MLPLLLFMNSENQAMRLSYYLWVLGAAVTAGSLCFRREDLVDFIHSTSRVYNMYR